MTTKIARMTAQTEGRIVAAVEDVVRRINDGADPNDAIEKVAAEARLPVGHVNLLVHAYNTGRTNRQREGHGGLLEKAASFPVADPRVILERLFPREVKSAAALERATGVHPDHHAPPHWYERARHAGHFEKAAAAAPPLVDKKPEPYPADPTWRAKRAYDHAARRARRVEQSRMEFSAAQDALVAGFQKLAAWLGDPGHPPLPAYREAVALLWGPPGTAVLDHLAATRPVLEKRASGPTATPVDRRADPYRMVDEVLALTARVKEARDDHAARIEEAAAQDREELSPFAPARRESPLGLPWAGPSEKRAGPYTTALGVQLSRDLLGRVGSGLGGPDTDSMAAKAQRQISSPDHEQALRGIHTQAMLQDLLANDPIISSYHPMEVTEAFNQVSQLAPHAAGQPAVVAPLLRKWLQQGNIDTFESGELVGTEERLKKIHGPAHDAAGGKGILRHGPSPTSLLAK